MTTEGSVRVGGRTVTYLEAGDPAGPLVLHNHGGPSSRLEAELFDSQAKANGLRFVCADRPGIGGSDPQPGRTWEGWADDLLSLADSLGAHRFAVSGWSEGGPWALAASAYLDPARLVHVSCIGGASYGTFGANWSAKYLSSVDALGGRLALHFQPGFKLMYEVLGMSAKHFGDRYATAIKKSRQRGRSGGAGRRGGHGLVSAGQPRMLPPRRGRTRRRRHDAVRRRGRST